jgi:hypothetical protein
MILAKKLPEFLVEKPLKVDLGQVKVFLVLESLFFLLLLQLFMHLVVFIPLKKLSKALF